MFFDQLLALIGDPIAFSVPYPFFQDGALAWGSLPIYWYGILIAVGIGAGAFVAGREIERRGHSADDYYNGLLITVIAGYIIARLGFVIQDSLAGNGAAYQTILDVFNIRGGGVNILWGFSGAVFIGFWFARRQQLAIWDYADVAGLTILLAQGIGRWGNFINQELYGPPTGSNWGLLIQAPFRISPYNDLNTYPLDTRFHPTFLYESVALLLGFAISMFLIFRYREYIKSGVIFGFFLVWWGGNRAWLELFRPDQPNIGNTPLTYSMLIAIAIALAGVYVWLLRSERIAPIGASSSRRSQLNQRRVKKPKRQRQ
ncbi:MAG: prolipoprotein diacylglyceryl transferase [Chloroflexota bacterium]